MLQLTIYDIRQLNDNSGGNWTRVVFGDYLIECVCCDNVTFCVKSEFYYIHIFSCFDIKNRKLLSERMCVSKLYHIVLSLFIWPFEYCYSKCKLKNFPIS